MALASTIAIDGPAGSGKTTVGAALAARYGYVLFDSGIVYRAATLAALRRGVDVTDEDALADLAAGMDVQVGPATAADGRLYTVFLDGEDVTWALREADVDANVSPVSAHPRVRQALLALQRRVAAQGRVVVVGRDIGTVVLPEADVKIYLDASPEERARRRHAELLKRGLPASYDEVLANVRLRDRIDSTRPVAPLCRASDAHYVDSSGLSVDEVVARIVSIIEGSSDSVSAAPVAGRSVEAAGGSDGKLDGRDNAAVESLAVSEADRTALSPGFAARPWRFNRWHFPLKRLLRFLLSLFVRLDVEGLDGVPESQPVILYINHTNWLDPVLAAGIVEREVTVMGKVELFRNPLLGAILSAYGVFPVRRTEGDVQAIKRALRILKAGGLLIMSPEGHRSHHGSLQPAKAGMLALATRSGALLQPVAITGCQPIDANMRKLRRTSVRVRVGEAYRPVAREDRPSREEMERLTDEAMAKLAALLPPEYRGVYGDSGMDAGGFVARRAASA